MDAYFRILVTGPVNEAAVRTLRELDLRLSRRGAALVVSGYMDQPMLHGVLERIRVLRLDLLELQRVRVGHG